MTVVGICRLKDEVDILEETIRHMASQVDSLLVWDNGSSDGSLELLLELEKELPLRLETDSEVGYYQARQMTLMAENAYTSFLADWVVPFDADEFWYSPFGRIKDVLDAMPQASVAEARLFDHVATAEDGEGSPLRRLGWRREEPAPLPKVACRTRPRVSIHQGNHDASFGERISDQLVVRHFPYRSEEQFVKKVRNGAAAYAATNLPEHVGQHWRDYGRILDAEGPEALGSVFRSWFFEEQPAQAGLIFDPALAIDIQRV